MEFKPYLQDEDISYIMMEIKFTTDKYAWPDLILTLEHNLILSP